MSHPAPSTPDDRVEPARSFQHYEVLKRTDGSAWELGRGTMGITYKAFDVNLCCEVALKVVNAALLDAPNARERFVREARAAAALRHRNVASVYHLGNDGERFFYAMEFIDGETLDALVRRKGPLPVETALLLTEQAARALAAAERQGLVHRDIKPANIMVVHEDADDHMVVKVIDFGLARPAAGKGGSTGQLTVHGFVGTPQFASPEQLEEQGLDVRADIYSLGVTLWFLLTGRAPFAGSLATICHQHLTALPPWDHLPEGLPAPVNRLLAHMLEKDRAHRPQNAVELRREIDDCLNAVRQLPGPEASPRRADARPRPQSGMVIKSRYKVGRPIGEGTRGRMFAGRDTQADGALVTITFLSAQRLPGPADAEQLADEVRLVQAAAHPHLAGVFAFERAAEGREAFLVEEAINGGTLVDLLAARGGPLSTVETLRLIGQAAAAADHAASRRLEHLGLAVHQVCLHFETVGADDARAHLSAAMKDWPKWALKIDPLATIGESSEVKTWTGDVTLVPGVHPAQAGGAGQLSHGTLGIAYLHALAALTYELLGGAPDAWRKAAGAGGQYTSLPALNEEANTVLRLALTGRSGLSRSRHFYEALARAEGFDPLNLQVASAMGTRAVSSIATSPPLPTRRTSTVRPERVPDQQFVQPDAEELESYSEASIADRLTLVSGDASPIGRWFFALTALAVVFVLAVAGAWIVLAQRVSRDAPANRETVKTPAYAAHHRAASTPRPLVPPPLAKEVVSHTPAPTPTTTPIAASAPPVPAPTPTPTPSPSNATVIVRVKSIPTGAEILMAGKPLGVTPFDVELPVGTCELVAQLNGWPETRHIVVLNESLSRVVTEIRMIPPDFVPYSEVPTPNVSVPPSRPYRMPAPPTPTPDAWTARDPHRTVLEQRRPRRDDPPGAGSAPGLAATDAF